MANSFSLVLPDSHFRGLPMNKLFYGDNLDILRKFVRDETVDLCNTRPPPNSKRNYNQIYNIVGKIKIANNLTNKTGKYDY